MDLIYKIPNEQKINAMNIIESGKYDTISFAKTGYVVKDGEQYGIENFTLVILRNIDDEFVNFTKEKLKNIEGIETLDENKTNEIVKSINEEEERAQSGFGEIFG
jgi:hypothetical protein